MTKTNGKKNGASGEKSNSCESSFQLYLKEISNIPLLSKEEEREIAKLATQGDQKAKEKLINSNLRFVISIAKKYQRMGLPLQDLISEGNIGLMNAVNYFDIEKGYRFITYAVWWIRQAIVKAIHDKGRMIRLPMNKSNELKKIERACREFRGADSKKNPLKIHDIAKRLDIKPEKAEDLFRIGREVISLDTPASKDDSTFTIKDLIEDDCNISPGDNAVYSVLKEDLESFLDQLEERSADVIRCRFGLGGTARLTLKEVGDRYNLSRERIRQIEKNVFAQMQASMFTMKLKGYIA